MKLIVTKVRGSPYTDDDLLIAVTQLFITLVLSRFQEAMVKLYLYRPNLLTGYANYQRMTIFLTIVLVVNDHIKQKWNHLVYYLVYVMH